MAPGRRQALAALRPPVWAADLARHDPALAEMQAWYRQWLRAERLGDDLARRRARAGWREVRAAVLPAQPARLRRAWAAIEYTEECLVRERVTTDGGHHDPTLCYLCDPQATLALTAPLAIGYATAALFQVENGDVVDREFLADWSELRRARGVRAVSAAALAHSAEARDDLRALVIAELDAACLAYPVAHVRRWQGMALGRREVDAILTRVVQEAERHWLGADRGMEGDT